MFKKIAVLGIAAAMALMGGVMTASPARAYNAVGIRVHNYGVSSNAPFKVEGRLQTWGNPVTWAYWHAVHGEGIYSGWAFWNPYAPNTTVPDGTVTSWTFTPGSGTCPVGTWRASAVRDARGPNNQIYDQVGAAFAIKWNSSIRLSGYRSGSYVYLRALVKRWEWSLNQFKGGWKPSVDRVVSLFGQSLPAQTARTGTNGYTRYVRFYAPRARGWDGYVQPTVTIWGSRGTGFYR